MSDHTIGIAEGIPRFAIVQCDLNYKVYQVTALTPTIVFWNKDGALNTVEDEEEIAEIWSPMIAETMVLPNEAGKLSAGSKAPADQWGALREKVIFHGTTYAVFTNRGLRLTASAGRSDFGSLQKGETAVVVAMDYADVDLITVSRYRRQYCELSLVSRWPRAVVHMRVASYTTDGSRAEVRLVKNADARPLFDLVVQAACQELRGTDLEPYNALPIRAQLGRHVGDWIGLPGGQKVPVVAGDGEIEAKLFTYSSEGRLPG